MEHTLHIPCQTEYEPNGPRTHMVSIPVLTKYAINICTTLSVLQKSSAERPRVLSQNDVLGNPRLALPEVVDEDRGNREVDSARQSDAHGDCEL